MIDSEGVTENVLLAGDVAHPVALSVCKELADVMVRPALVDGDSSFVREAIALCKPIVASDTDFRPDGVVLFRRGDAEDLASKVEYALSDTAEIQNRMKQLEKFRTVRSGNDGQSEPIVLQCEHVRDFCVADLDFSYGLGHIIADVEVVGGGHQTEPIGVPVPLWHLVFHDAVVLPHAGGEALNFLHGNPPWFSAGGYAEHWDGVPGKELEVKRRVMALHEDVGLLEMTDHRLVEADGSIQQTVFGGGVTVTLDSNSRTVKIEGGRAETKGEVPYDYR